MNKLYFKILLLILVLTVGIGINADAQTNGYTNGTYDFGLLGSSNSGGSGFKTLGDKFFVSNLFEQDGTVIFNQYGTGAHTNGATSTAVIKANGGTCKRFTLKDMSFSSFYLSPNSLAVFNLKVRDVSGGQIASHSISSSFEMGSQVSKKLSDILGSSWPAGGYNNVSEIEITWKYTNVSPDVLNFESITLANVSSTALSSNANLSNLTLSSGSLAPTFAAGTTSYTAYVAANISTINLSPTLADATATVKVNGSSVSSGSASASVSLSYGSNSIPVLVTAQDGTVKTYTVTVIRLFTGDLTTQKSFFRPKRADEETGNLDYTKQLIPSDFSAGNQSFNYYVQTIVPKTSGIYSFEVTSCNFIGNPPGDSFLLLYQGSFDPNQPMLNLVGANDDKSGSDYKSLLTNISMQAGNTYVMVVTSFESGVTGSASFAVLGGAVDLPASLSSNANLSSLTLSHGTLSPVFASGTTSYTASVGNNINSIMLTPTVADATATVKINGTSVGSGLSHGVVLNVGANTFTVVVTAQDGSTKTYTVTVTRAGSSNNLLSNLWISDGTLSPAFAAGTTSYTASVANTITSVNVSPTIADATASVSVNGFVMMSGLNRNVPLNVGANTITVLVTAQDGTTKPYTIIITRENSPVAAVNAAADASQMQVALEDVALALNLGAYSGWTTADKAAVSAAVLATRPGGGYADVAAVQAVFDNALVARAPVAAVNIAADASTMQTALEDAAFALNLGVYATWTAADKAAVAAEMLANRSPDGYTDLAEVQTTFDAIVAMRSWMAAVNMAGDASSMQTALEDAGLGLTLGAYSGWSAADKAAVSADVLASRPAGGYADMASVQAAFDNALSARAAVAAVNNAADAASMKNALEDATLALNLGMVYPAMSSSTQAAVAADMLANRPAGGYADMASIQTAFDAAVAAHADNTAPSVTISSTKSDPTNANPIPVKVEFSEDVTGFIASDITINYGTVSNFSGSGKIYTFDLTPTTVPGTNRADGVKTVNIAANVAQDAAGNGNTAATEFAITFDALYPFQQGNSSKPADGTYHAGDNLDFTVSLNEAVTVTGNPRLTLLLKNNNSNNEVTVYADYVSGSGTNQLVFRYTVQAGRADNNGIGGYSEIDLNGGTIIDAAGNQGIGIRTGLGSMAGILIDGTASPTDISLSASAVNENVAANSTIGILSTTDTDAGDTFTYSLVSGTGDTDNASFNISGSNLRITASPDFETKNSYSIRVRTTDQAAHTFEKVFTITINDQNEDPQFTTTPVTEATVGSVYNYPVKATDPFNNTLSLTYPVLPAWLTLDGGANTSDIVAENIAGPGGSAEDADGNIYVTELNGTHIYKIPRGGQKTLWATRSAGLVYGITVHNGYLYIAYSNGAKVTKINLNNPGAGEINVLSPLVGSPINMTVYNGNMYIPLLSLNKVIKVDLNNNNITDFVTGLNKPYGLGFDKNGVLYITDYYGGKLSKFDGTLTTIISDLVNPTDVKVDGKGNVYVSSFGAGIRKYSANLTNYMQIDAGARIWSMSLAPSGELVYALNDKDQVVTLQTSGFLGGTPGINDIGVHPVTVRVSNGVQSKDQSFNITVTGPATLTNFAAVNKTYGDAPFTLSAPGSTNSNGTFTYASSDPAVATINGNIVTILKAGTAIITATQAASGNYTGASTTATLTVSPKPITVTAHVASKTYGENDPALTYAITSGTLVGSDAFSGSLSRVAGENAGTYEINKNTLSLGDNYALTFVPAQLTINKKALTVTVDDKAKTYGDSNPAFTVQYTGLVNGETIISPAPTFNTSATANSGAGIYDVEASGSSDNYEITFVKGKLTINKKALTITADNKTKVYGSANPAFTLSYDGLVNGETALSPAPTVSTAATTASKVGEYAIQASGSHPNYEITFVNGKLTINKKALKVTADNQAKTYGEQNPALTVSYDGLVNGETALNPAPVMSTVATAASPVGQYDIEASGPAENYTVTFVKGKLTVNKKALIVTAEDKVKTYGEANPALTVKYTGLVNGETALNPAPLISTSATTLSGAGVYDINASASSANYAITIEKGKLTINKKAVTVSVDNKSKVYGEANPAFTVQYSGLVNGETALNPAPSLTTAATAASGVGQYAIEASGTFANYEPTFVNGKLTVNKKALKVTADNKTKIYGSANPAFTLSYDGLVNGETALSPAPAVSTTATAASKVGEYVIAASGNNPNYEITFVNGKLTVNKKALKVTADNKAKVYGEQNPALTVSYDGLVNGETVLNPAPVISTLANTASAVGQYDIEASGSALNYEITFVKGKFTVNKKTLTVKADNKEKFFGTVNPALTVSYDGFTNGDNANSLTALPVAVTNASTTSDFGNYAINVSGAASANYSFNYVPGTLTIRSGAPTSISLAAATLFENKPAGTLAGTLSSVSNDPGATFTYSLVNGTGSEDNALFSISGNKLSTAQSLDYEQKKTYSVLVRSTTQYGLTLDKALTISLRDVNEVPTIAAISNQVICYDNEQHSVMLSGISAGPEASQSVSLKVSSSNTNLFSQLTVNPKSNGSAELKYRVKEGETGTATVHVTVLDNGGSENNGIDNYTRSFTITVNSLPEVTISSDKGTAISKGDEIVLTATGGTTYKWMNAPYILAGQNTASLRVRPEVNTTYEVLVTNANGCVSSKSISIEVNEDYKVNATNILTPDGDGKNDKWVIKNLDMYPQNEVKIFDLAGRLIFSKKNYENEWDGTFNGFPLAEDTYYYIIDFGPNKAKKKGFITIVKK